MIMQKELSQKQFQCVHIKKDVVRCFSILLATQLNLNNKSLRFKTFEMWYKPVLE